MRRWLGLTWGLVLWLVVTAGCAPFHDASDLKQPDYLPETFSLYENLPTPGRAWWQNFQNEELRRLIETALAQNLSLSQQLARLDQARARTVVEGAARYPDLKAAAGVSRGRRWIRDENNDRGEDIENYTVGLVSNYEVDLWGRVRADREAAQLTFRPLKPTLMRPL